VKAKSKVDYYSLHFKPESDPPVISFEKVQVLNQGKNAKFIVRAKDASKVAKVVLRYKEMPTYKLWQSAFMKQTSPGVFEAEVPLTPEGILYAVNAADEHGNATSYPDFLKETPYRWIDAWDPAKNPYK